MLLYLLILLFKDNLFQRIKCGLRADIRENLDYEKWVMIEVFNPFVSNDVTSLNSVTQSIKCISLVPLASSFRSVNFLYHMQGYDVL